MGGAITPSLLLGPVRVLAEYEFMPPPDDTSNPRALRVLLLEDEAFTRATVAGSLRLHGLDVVAEAANGGEAMRMARVTRPDVLVADLDLGGGPDGIATAHALRNEHPRLAVVLLTAYSDPRLLTTTVGQAPKGAEYVIKQAVADASQLVLAIERAVRASPGSGAVRPTTSQPLMADLTDVQLDTLRMLAEGMTNAEIAAARGVSTNTVERAVARIAVILGVQSNGPGNERVLLARAYLAMARG